MSGWDWTHANDNNWIYRGILANISWGCRGLHLRMPHVWLHRFGRLGAQLLAVPVRRIEYHRELEPSTNIRKVSKWAEKSLLLVENAYCRGLLWGLKFAKVCDSSNRDPRSHGGDCKQCSWQLGKNWIWRMQRKTNSFREITLNLIWPFSWIHECLTIMMKQQLYKNTFLARKGISNSTNTHHNYFKLALYSLKTPDSNRCLLDTQISLW